MFTNKEEAYYSIILFSLFVFLLITIIVATAILYYNRRKKFLLEKNALKVEFAQTLLQSKLEIQEQTFNTISQEIHDNVGQTLSLAKVQVNIIEQSETTDKRLLADVKENIGKAMTDLRDLAKGLNTNHIQLTNLKDLIIPELARMERSRILNTSLREDGKLQVIAHQKKLILFRIVQEALQNIIKHAKAYTADVSLKYAEHHLHVTISDDGKGFDQNKIEKTDGLGLQNIVSRAKLIGGRNKHKSGYSIVLYK